MILGLQTDIVMGDTKLVSIPRYFLRKYSESILERLICHMHCDSSACLYRKQKAPQYPLNVRVLKLTKLFLKKETAK